jgi:hypothetical protein
MTIEEFYNNRPKGCTCRPRSLKLLDGTEEVRLREADQYGCKVHCTHYGLARGQWVICACGWQGFR